MSRPIVKLIHGKDSLNLQSAADGATGRYKVAQDFAPPTAARSVTYSTGIRGSNAAQKTLENINFGFGVHIKAKSPQEAERAKRELQSFLNRAGGSEPLYLAYRSWDDYDFEPFFGLHGAYARFEIVHGALGATGTTSQFTANALLNVPVNLVIKPQSVALQQHAGQATGGIFEDFIGKANGLSRGTVIAEGTTNKMTNPAFMHGTYNNRWTGSSVLDAENKEADFVLFGDTSARLVQVALNGTYTATINAGNTNTHTLSFYARRADGGTIDSNAIRAYYGAQKTTTYVYVGNGWYYCWASFAGIASNTSTGLIYAAALGAAATEIYVDGFQLEELSSPTPFCYGDLLGCTWASTKNDSTSTRTQARLRYNYADALNRLNGFTVRIVWLPKSTDLVTNYYLYEDSDSDLALWLDSSQRYNFSASSGSSIQSAAVSLDDETPEVIHVAYDGAMATVYRNGVSLVSGSSTINATKPTYLYVGSQATPVNQINSTVMGFATYQREMSAAEVLADYNSLAQQVTDGDRIDPLPWVWTVDGDNIVDNDNDGTLHNYCVVGGLMGDDVDVSYKLDSSNSFVLGPGITWSALPVDQRDMDKDILTTGGTNTLLFVNGSGTADADANANNVSRISLSTSTSTAMATAISKLGARMLQRARAVSCIVIAKDAGSNENVQVQMQVTFGANAETYFSSDWITVPTSAAFRPYITDELPFDLGPEILDSTRKVGFQLRFRRISGSSTQNFDISHAVWLVNHSTVYTADVGGTVAVDMCYVRDTEWEGVDDASPTLTIGRRTFNRPLYIRPELLNVLMLQHTAAHTADTSATWATGYNLEIEQFAVTPRFDIF